MIKLGLAIALTMAVAGLSVLGSPLFAVLLVAPVAIFYSAWAGRATVEGLDGGSTEEDPGNVAGGEPGMRGRPAGTAEDRRLRRERAERLRSEDSV